jgi:hypothetical protein
VPDLLLPAEHLFVEAMSAAAPRAQAGSAARAQVKKSKKAPAPGLGQRFSRLAFAIIFSPEISSVRGLSKKSAGYPKK